MGNANFDRILKGFQKSIDDARRVRKAFGANLDLDVSESHPPAKVKPRKGSPKRKRREAQ